MKSVFVIDCQPFAVIVEIHTTVTETDVPHAQVLTQLGKGRYTSFQAQLHEQNGKGQPDPSLETSCLHKLQHLCPAQNGDSNQTTNLDLCTPTPFDTSTTRICRPRMSSYFQMRYCLPYLVIASPSLTCMQVARRHSSITLLHQC
ncbi:unnamed protein product [Sphagnum troendelagicum]|uniref:Uncharacterized protein n=1 Tax=Sphagnum troendelagicum TaxID=128251 RepID=A0ABP0UCV4_9BRYO